MERGPPVAGAFDLGLIALIPSHCNEGRSVLLFGVPCCLRPCSTSNDRFRANADGASLWMIDVECVCLSYKLA